MSWSHFSNQMYSRWLSSGHGSDKLQFLNARRQARQAVRTAKNTWFQNKANEAQKERFGGKKVWLCIREMQRGHCGLVPTRTAAMVRDEDGTPCTTTHEQHQHWRRYFSSVLNTCSRFSLEELGKVEQRAIRAKMADLPTMDRLLYAVGKLKSGKAGGSSEVLPEMLKTSCYDAEFRHLILDLLHSVWKERQAPHRTGLMQCWCQFPKRVTLPSATTGGEYHYSM